MTGDRDSFQLVQDPYVRVLYNKRGVSDYTLYDEAGIFERTGVPPSQYVLLAALRGDPSDNLPGRARRGGEDRGQAAHQVRRPRRDLRPPRRADAQAAREPGGERGAGPLQRPHHPPRARRAPRRGRRPPDPGRVGPRHGRGDLRSLRDEDGLAAHGGAARRRRAGGARRGQCGPAAGSAVGEAAAPAPPSTEPAAPAAPAFELRDVALPTTAAEITKQLDRARHRPARPGRPLERHARAQRPRRAGAGGDRGRGGRPRRAGARRPARRRPGGRGAQRRPGPPGPRAQRQGGHAVAAAPRHRPHRPRDGHRAWRPTCSMRRRASTSWRSCASRRASSASTSSSPARRRGTWPRRRRARRPTSPAMATGFRRRLAVRGHGHAPRRHRDAARAGPGQDGGGRHRRGPGRAAERSPTRSRPRPAALQGEVQELRRPRVQRQLHAAAAHRALRRARPDAGQEDQDRLLDRRPDARDPARAPIPIIEALLSYREVEKLRSTYGESLLAEVQADGRIHASFGQTVARTGRISSDRPNLHNIPVRTEQGKQFRRAFVPAEGCHLPGGRLRPGGAALHRAPLGGPGADRRADERAPTCTGWWPPPCTGSRPRRSPTPSASSARWSPTASPTAWRPTG